MNSAQGIQQSAHPRNQKNDHLKNEGSQTRGAEGQTRGVEGVFMPRVDIVETDQAFIMYAEMPGVKAGDVSLHCKDGELILRGSCAPRHDGRKPLHREYGVGDFYRSFTLSNLVDHNKIDARLENGVLVLSLPKTEAAKPRRISVKGG